MDRVADMTIDELRILVDEVVEKRIQAIFKHKPQRSVEEINATIRELRWKAPENTPSNLELLREG